MYVIKDIVVLVTGGAAGIGEEVVRKFLDEGAKHVSFLDVDVEKGKALEKELTTKYGLGRVTFYECDVTNSVDLHKCYEDILKNVNSIDVLVNNAGILNEKHIKRAVNINVTAVLENSLKAYSLMRKDRGGKGGTIINVASEASLINIAFVPVYSATKSAVMQFGLCLGAEPNYRHSGVRVVTMCFGMTDTTIFHETKCEFLDEESYAMFSAVPRYYQTTESAAKGLIEAYKRGASASTWLVTCNKPAMDITGDVTQAYNILSKHLKHLIE